MSKNDVVFAVVYCNKVFFKISFKFTDLQKVYLITHTLTDYVYNMFVNEVVCGCLLL